MAKQAYTGGALNVTALLSGLTGKKLTQALNRIEKFEAKVEANKGASIKIGADTFQFKKAAAAPAVTFVNGTTTFTTAAALETAATAPTPAPTPAPTAAPTPAPTAAPTALKVGAETLTGTAGNDTLSGTFGGLASGRTLDATDTIDGGAGRDTLNITDLGANFTGFTTGSLKNVEVVSLTGNDVARVFTATGVTGVEQYDISGTISLAGLAAAGITVNVAGIADTAAVSLGFTADAVKGTADKLALGVNGLGKAAVTGTASVAAVAQKTVSIAAAGVEDLSVVATGANFIDLSGASAAETLTITGSGAVTSNVGAALKSVDAAALAGALDINLGNATGVTKLIGGAGADTLRVTTGDLVANATVTGGNGSDTLRVAADLGTVQYTMTGVETVRLGGAGTTLFSVANSSGIEKIFVSKDATASTTTFAGFGSQALAVEIEGGGSTTHVVSLDHTGATTISNKVSSSATKDAREDASDNVTLSKSTSVTLNVAEFGNLTSNINAAKATSFSATARSATDLTGSTLTAVEVFSADTTKALSGTVALAAASQVTLGGTGDDAAVTLGAVGASTNAYGLGITASGLKAGLTVGAVSAGSGQTINVNISGVTGTASVASGDSIAATGGTVTVNAANVKGALTLGAVTGKTVSVDASNAGSTVTVGTLTGDTVTFNALGALGEVTAATVSVKNTLTYTGAALDTNAATVTINGGSDVNMFFKGGLQADAFTVTGFAASTVLQKLTVTGDLGLGNDAITVNLAGQASAGSIELNLSGLKAETANVTGVSVTQGGANFTYSGIDGSDVITLTNLGIAHTTGKVVLNLFAADGDADTVAFGSVVSATNGKAFEISGFEAGTSGSDVVTFAAGLLRAASAAATAGTNVAATTASATGANFAEVAKGSIGATDLQGTAVGFFEVTATGDVAAGRGTVAADVFAAIFGTAGLTGLSTSTGAAQKLFLIDDGTDTFLWLFSVALGANSTNATATTDDIQLIGVVKGVTDFAALDFNIG